MPLNEEAAQAADTGELGVDGERVSTARAAVLVQEELAGGAGLDPQSAKP